MVSTSLISAASQLPKFNARSSIGHFFSRYRNFFIFTWRWWWRIGIFNAMLKLLLIEMVNVLIKIHYYGCCSNKHKWYASFSAVANDKWCNKYKRVEKLY